jgi:hypothetical protein
MTHVFDSAVILNNQFVRVQDLGLMASIDVKLAAASVPSGGDWGGKVIAAYFTRREREGSQRLRLASKSRMED